MQGPTTIKEWGLKRFYAKAPKKQWVKQTLHVHRSNTWNDRTTSADPIREASKVSSGNNIAAITFRIEVPPYHHGYLMFHPKAVAPAEVKETGGIWS